VYRQPLVSLRCVEKEEMNFPVFPLNLPGIPFRTARTMATLLPRRNAPVKKEKSILLKKVLRYAIFFLIIVGLLMAASNIRKLGEIILSIRSPYLAAALICAFAVYLLEGVFLYLSLVCFGQRIPIFTAFRYALVINSIGYFVSMGGLAPFATQVHILDRHQINAKTALLSRILHLFLFNGLFHLMLTAGFLFLLFSPSIWTRYTIPVLAVTGTFVTLYPGLYLALFWGKFRRKVVHMLFRLINRLVGLFSTKVRLNPQWIFNTFDEFQEGFGRLTKNPLLFSLLSVTTVVIWGFWLSVMYMAFLSVNEPIAIGPLVIGFSTGQIVGVLSMIPGGIGTLEGSSALAYAALGIPFEVGLSALLIYRTTYYIIPFILSIPFYLGMKQKRKER